MKTIYVELDRIGDRPPNAGPDLELVGRQVADARSGLDKAAVDHGRDLAVSGIVRAGRGARGGAIGGRDRVRRANLRPHRVGQERVVQRQLPGVAEHRSEEHTSELQSLMRISYAVFCLKKKKNKLTHTLN